MAVLPFKNLSSDAGQAFFSDGIAEDVITALGRFSNLLVVGKSASFQFRDRNLPPAEFGRLLDARYLLEGSVQRRRDRVRVNVELTEAATGRDLWSQAYDAEVKDIFGVQDDIAQRVVGAAAVTLTRFERDRALAKPTASLAAYEYVLRGREHFTHTTRDGNDQAQDMFQRAIDLDPSYAAAYAELGLSLIEANASGWSEFVANDLDRAEKLGQKTLSLDPASTAAYRLLAEVDFQRRRFDLALGHTDRSLEINPSDADSSALRGIILAWAGRAAESLPWLEGALRLDPANGRASVTQGIAYYLLGRYGEAVASIDRGLAENSGRNIQITGRPILAAAYAELDRPEDAVRERNLALQLSPVSRRRTVRRAIRHAGGPRAHARRAEKGRVPVNPVKPLEFGPLSPRALLGGGERLDLHEVFGADQLRHRHDRAVRRRRAEVVPAQIGVFIEFSGLCHITDGKDDVLDRGAAGGKAGADVLPDLLDLRLEVALADDIAGLVARDLPGDDDPMPAVAQRDLGRRQRSGAGRADDLRRR